MTFSIIVAADIKNGIGKDNQLPWHSPKDMAYFRQITSHAPIGTSNAVIMGRKTWDSIPEKFKPLPHRYNMVLSRSDNLSLPDGVTKASSLETALSQLRVRQSSGDVASIFVIGGGHVYEQAIQLPACQHIYLTQIYQDSQADTFFPDLEAHGFSKTYASSIYVANPNIVFFQYSRR